jgi:hypothetical protein
MHRVERAQERTGQQRAEVLQQSRAFPVKRIFLNPYVEDRPTGMSTHAPY